MCAFKQGGLRTFEPVQPLNEFGFLHHRWNGKAYPPFIDPVITQYLIDNWDTDGQDVFICTHQKVGTHLTKKYIVEILRHTFDYPSSSPIAAGDIGHDAVPWPEVLASQYGLDYFFEYLENTRGFPRPWYIHCAVEDLPVKSVHPNTRFVPVFRDPRSVVVSQFFFYRSHPLLGVSENLDLEAFLPIFLDGELYFGDYYEHVCNWLVPSSINNTISPKQVAVFRYEELVEDKQAAVVRLADFLAPGHTLADAKIREMAESTVFQTMKQSIIERPGSFHFNPHTFFRAGTTNNWELHLNDQMLAEINAKTLEKWPGGTLAFPKV